jgi:hypothetical protein
MSYIKMKKIPFLINNLCFIIFNKHQVDAKFNFLNSYCNDVINWTKIYGSITTQLYNSLIIIKYDKRR